MVGVSAEGWEFIRQNLQYFVSESKLWYVFPLLMLLILLKRKKEYRLIGVYPYLIFAVTVCNPFLIDIVERLMGVSDRYYRFFWIIPLGITIGVVCAEIVNKAKRTGIKVLICIITAVFIIGLGCPVYFSETAPDYKKKENEFYNSDIIVEVSKELHKHGIEHPVVVYTNWMLYEMSQYDFEIISLFDREEIPALLPGAMDMLGLVTVEIDYELIIKYTYLTARVDLVTPELFRDAIEAVGVDYFVLPDTQENNLEFYEASGCVVSAKVDGYYVLYCDREQKL